MARRLDLIDQFTELVVGADDPRRLAERTLEVVMSLLNGRSSAVFTSAGNDVTLFASRGIDQAVLEIVPLAWGAQKDSLRRGELLYVPDRIAERRVPTLPPDRPGPASFADPAAPATVVSFPVPGSYVLRLTAGLDGAQHSTLVACAVVP